MYICFVCVCVFFFYILHFCISSVIRDDNLVRHINLHAFAIIIIAIICCVLVDCIFRPLNYPPIYYSLYLSYSLFFKKHHFKQCCMCASKFIITSFFSIGLRTKDIQLLVVCLVIVFIYLLIKTFSSIAWIPVAK